MDAPRYKAFISYAHEDAEWARWAHRSIERFRLPKPLRTAAKSGHLRPVFRDKDELGSAANLSSALIDALNRSDALIVICSPAAVASNWVNEEIRTFRQLHSEARILCLLVAGQRVVPEDVFPNALLQELNDDGTPGGLLPEPLAIDPRSEADGRRGALQKLVAGLLDVPFDQVRERDRQWRRRRFLGAFVSTAVATIALVAGTYLLTRQPDCLSREQLTAELWDEQHRRVVQEAFLATGLSFAERSWIQVDRAFASYALSWAASHLDACEATRVRREQSEQLMDRRMACLTERRVAFIALRNELSRISGETLEFAAPGVLELKSLARCDDTRALEAAYPPPDDPVIAETVRTVGRSIARTRAKLRAGQSEGSLVEATKHSDAASDTDYPPLEADALLLLGEAQLTSAAPEEAKNTYYQAAAKAIAARDSELAAAAWLKLPGILMQTERDAADEISNVLDLAESYVRQLPGNPPVWGEYLEARGASLVRIGASEEGIGLLEAAVEFAREHDPANLAGYLSTLTWALIGSYDLDKAAAASQEAVTLAAAAYGSDHPLYAVALREEARVASRRGEFDRAVDLLTDVLAILRTAYPPTHSKIAHVLNDLAWDLKNLGRWDEAERYLQEALALQQSLVTPYWLTYGSVHNIFADYYLSRGEYAMARQHFQEAIDIWSNSETATANISIAYNNLGNLENREGRYANAREHCQRSLDLDVELHGTDFRGLAYPLSCLGEALTSLGELELAIDALERAHDLRDHDGANQLTLAWSRWLLGRALWLQGEEPERAKGYILFAHEALASAGEGAASELGDVTAWIDANGLEWLKN